MHISTRTFTCMYIWTLYVISAHQKKGERRGIGDVTSALKSRRPVFVKKGHLVINMVISDMSDHDLITRSPC